MVAKKKCNKDDIETALNTIRPLVAAKVITAREIENISKIDYPIFSFKYICNYSFDKCKDVSFFKEFLIRLQKLSTLGWKKIALSDRHSFGIEKIDVSQIKPKEKLPPFITDDMKLDVFRATGDNHPFVGIRKGRTFYIFFIETSFGDVYDHD